MLFIIIIEGILVLFIYITRLASNEILSSSNKILIITLILLRQSQSGLGTQTDIQPKLIPPILSPGQPRL